MRKLFTVILMLIAISVSVYAQNNKSAIMKSPAQGLKFVTNRPSSLLYDQMNPGDYGIADQILSDYGYCKVQGADDFIAPVPWTIDRVEVIGWADYEPANFFDVFFYVDNAGVPGTEVYHGAGLASSVNNYYFYSIPLTTPAVLPAGHYFVSVLPTRAYGAGNQWWDLWWWLTLAPPQIGNVAIWRDPCDFFQTGYTDWTPATTVWPGYGINDYCFALYGVKAADVPVSNWALFIGIGLILVFAVVRFRKIV
jgi:hypothetical protein